jgi:ubiquitin carboxyl-terminal hydrolase 14
MRQTQTGSKVGRGLTPLFNFYLCSYMASTLQCLRAVPEFKTALINKSNGVQPQQHDPNFAVVRELGRLYSQMDKTTSPVVPMMFTQTFRSVFPQFDQTDSHGHHAQQDAEEAMIQLLNSASIVLKNTAVGSASASNDNNAVDEYFGFRTETRTVPVGTSAQDPSAKVAVETQRRLRCFVNSEVNFLFQGVKLGLREEIELRGQLLERTSTLVSLPKYLIVQMMRFDWLQVAKQKAKMLKKVDFGLKFDISDFCHSSLKHQLTQARNFIKEEQDAKLGLTSLTKKPKTAEGQTAGSSPPAAAASDSAAAASNPWASSSAMEVDSGAGSSSSSSGLTLTTGTSGQYELMGVVSHKGRSADGGRQSTESIRALMRATFGSLCSDRAVCFTLFFRQTTSHGASSPTSG